MYEWQYEGHEVASNIQWEVVVGNIGSVYMGSVELEAMAKYDIYVDLSMTNYGRASGEPVTLFKDGEIVKEYEPNPYGDLI